jgi:integrase/recombinase XerD
VHLILRRYSKVNNINITFKSILANILKGYVEEKQAVGYKYHKEARTLRRFDEFCISVNHDKKSLTKELVLEWCQKQEHEKISNQNTRISLLRCLAVYMVRLGFKAYIYPVGINKVIEYGYKPYIFSENEIAKLLIEADRLKPDPASPYRHIVLPLLFRILYGCGLRISEALLLQVRDVDFNKGTLLIREAKLNKDRIVPVHQKMCKSLGIYTQRIHAFSKPEDIFFPSSHGGRYSTGRIYDYFRRLIWKAGISHGGRGKGPRLHDIRHAFAVHCLKKWVKESVDLTVVLPYLSAYLGHTGLKSTQHYLRLTAELYPDIVSAVENEFSHIIPEI